LAGGSRLLIDCNRPLDSPTSIPEVSEIPIPGNRGMNLKNLIRPDLVLRRLPTGLYTLAHRP
jgi:predicted N-formylglutamate amidohydrolase